MSLKRTLALVPSMGSMPSTHEEHQRPVWISEWAGLTDEKTGIPLACPDFAFLDVMCGTGIAGLSNCCIYKILITFHTVFKLYIIAILIYIVLNSMRASPHGNWCLPLFSFLMRSFLYEERWEFHSSFYVHCPNSCVLLNNLLIIWMYSLKKYLFSALLPISIFSTYLFSIEVLEVLLRIWDVKSLTCK